MLDLKPLVNRTIPFKFNGAELRFDLSHALFSSYEVDLGTRLLLKTVARDPVLATARRVLDAGCGTGVIGIAVAKAFPNAEVFMRDRDSLAVAFTERNRLANRLRGSPAWTDPATGILRPEAPAPRSGIGLLSDGREGGPYDFILSNLPAKAGAPVLEAFFAGMLRKPAAPGAPGQSPAGSDASGLLTPGGRLVVVIVNTLAEAASLWIAAAGLSVLRTERGSGHTVFVLECGAAGKTRGTAERPFLAMAPVVAEGAGPEIDLTGIDLLPYVRSECSFKLNTLSYRARGFWGLPDFDTVGYAQALGAEAVERGCAGSLVREALVVNPGVGHLALWIAKKLGPVGLTAASRDLLALAATGANLSALSASSRPRYRAVDALRLDELGPASFDLLVETPDLVPSYDWIAPAWDRAARLVKSGGTCVFICPPTEMTRLEKRRPKGWRLLSEKRRKGFAAAAYRRN